MTKDSVVCVWGSFGLPVHMPLVNVCMTMTCGMHSDL